MPNFSQRTIMQVKICYTQKQWEHLSRKIGNKDFNLYFMRAIARHFPDIDKEDDIEDLPVVRVNKAFNIRDDRLKKEIKKRAISLKIKPATLLSRIIFDPLLFQK